MHAECRAIVGARVEGNAPALALDEHARDREPEADAGHVARAGSLAAVEGLEEALGVLRRDPGPRVGDHDDRLVVSRRDGNPDLATGRRELHGVVENVGERHLRRDRRRVREHVREPLGDDDHALLLGSGPHGEHRGFDAGELHVTPPFFSRGEAVMNYLGALGIKLKMRPMERAAFFAAWGAKKLKGVCVCGSGLYGNAATRMSEIVPSDGTYAYGGYPDIDALYRQQAVETDRKKREALLYQIQQTLHERVRFGPIFEFLWPSGIGPRVEEPALMLINPYPWSAPLEEVRLKKR